MPGKAPEFDSSPDMGGFTISFFLPFVADDLYNELLSEFPLGSSPNVTFTILRSGYSGPVISARRRGSICSAATASLPSTSSRSRAARAVHSCAYATTFTRRT